MRMDSFRIVVIVMMVLLAASVIYIYLHRPRIGYVRSYELIEKYQGTIDARAAFEKKKSSMSANVDSLRLDFERARNQYVSNLPRLSTAQRTEQEKMLGQRQGQLMQYTDAIEQKIMEEDNRMMQQVLNQVNSFVESYALQEGYDVILGTTTSGSLLYGNKDMDITEVLLDELNANYKGE